VDIEGEAMAKLYCKPIGDTGIRDIPHSWLLQ
jgi:hypothetical protein